MSPISFTFIEELLVLHTSLNHSSQWSLVLLHLMCQLLVRSILSDSNSILGADLNGAHKRIHTNDKNNILYICKPIKH